MQQLTLRARIALGFAALIIISAIMGGLAIITMKTASTNILGLGNRFRRGGISAPKHRATFAISSKSIE